MSNKNPIVNIDKNKWPYYKKYASPSTKKEERPLFSRMIDLFLFAAVYGFKHCKPQKISPKPERPFRWSNFNDDDSTLIKAIALNVTKDAEVILNKEKMLRIVEEYANGGIDELISIIEEPGDKEVHILKLLSEIEDE